MCTSIAVRRQSKRRSQETRDRRPPTGNMVKIVKSKVISQVTWPALKIIRLTCLRHIACLRLFGGCRRVLELLTRRARCARQLGPIASSISRRGRLECPPWSTQACPGRAIAITVPFSGSLGFSWSDADFGYHHTCDDSQHRARALVNCSIFGGCDLV